MEPTGAKVARLELDEFLLQCQLNWKIDDFINWASTPTSHGHHLDSTIQEFTFPDVEETYKFSLRVVTTPGRILAYLVNRTPKGLINTKVQLFVSSPKRHIRIREREYEFFGDGDSVRAVISPDKLSEPDSSRGLSFQCNVTIIQPTLSVTKAPKSRERKRRCHEECFGQESMKKLRSDSNFADFEIVCEGKTFRCHKNILAIRSTVLAEMMKTERWNEGKNNSLEIKDFDQVFKTPIQINI